jgi:hypothetical protein
MEPESKHPAEEDLMQFARLGEIKAIQKPFESGKFSATYTDEQGVTSLYVSLENQNERR